MEKCENIEKFKINFWLKNTLTTTKNNNKLLLINFKLKKNVKIIIRPWNSLPSIRFNLPSKTLHPASKGQRPNLKRKPQPQIRTKKFQGIFLQNDR